MPDLHQVRRGFQRAELVVVSDAYHPTETTRFADVLLPAAQWGEKEWTSTNSERMVSHSPKLLSHPARRYPTGKSSPVFAQTLGHSDFNYSSAAEVWDEFIGLTAGRPCDMAGMTAERYGLKAACNGPAPCSITRERNGAISIINSLRRTAVPCSCRATTVSHARYPTTSSPLS